MSKSAAWKLTPDPDSDGKYISLGKEIIGKHFFVDGKSVISLNDGVPATGGVCKTIKFKEKLEGGRLIQAVHHLLHMPGVIKDSEE